MKLKCVSSDKFSSTWHHIPYSKRVMESRIVGVTKYSGRHVEGGTFTVDIPDFKDFPPDPVVLWRHVYDFGDEWKSVDLAKLELDTKWNGSAAYFAGDCAFQIVAPSGATTIYDMFSKACIVRADEVERSPLRLVLYGNVAEAPGVTIADNIKEAEAKTETKGDNRDIQDREFEDGDCHIVFSTGEIVMYDFRTPAIKFMEDAAAERDGVIQPTTGEVAKEEAKAEVKVDIKESIKEADTVSSAPDAAKAAVAE